MSAELRYDKLFWQTAFAGLSERRERSREDEKCWCSHLVSRRFSEPGTKRALLTPEAPKSSFRSFLLERPWLLPSFGGSYGVVEGKMKIEFEKRGDRRSKTLS